MVLNWLLLFFFPQDLAFVSENVRISHSLKNQIAMIKMNTAAYHMQYLRRIAVHTIMIYDVVVPDGLICSVSILQFIQPI